MLKQPLYLSFGFKTGDKIKVTSGWFEDKIGYLIDDMVNFNNVQFEDGSKTYLYVSEETREFELYVEDKSSVKKSTSDLKNKSDWGF